MALEFGEDVVQAGAGDIHLVERLHRGKPRRAAPVGLALVFGLAGFHARCSQFENAREPEQGERCARGVAAFVAFVYSGALPGLMLVVDGKNAVAERNPARDRQVHEPACGFLCHDIEMNGVAADHATKRHGAVIRLAFSRRPRRAPWRGRSEFRARRAR